ncbi:hypothetical protein LOK49_LG08G02561 [Camellia lanceoleosa]|uniref:Uncharacterized protein n=1 Tax=Camellia lanceoleosa TaxID=1840588 RepID=A0ACC0GQB1_9ERIC|nr:hypothetical protein LOK49_LG08G02561 [Camellia lanceoleosa]
MTCLCSAPKSSKQTTQSCPFDWLVLLLWKCHGLPSILETK